MSSVVNFAKSAAADNECENGLIASIYRAAMSPGPWDTLLTLLISINRRYGFPDGEGIRIVGRRAPA